ncbi:hypothetical protein EB795_03765 [Pseudomonas mandelii]|uniref:hypothetical protein n=1 Tax=Pseudomonas mandelii TaxID=75612 RepID=UPI0012B25891|nr:hypothetical protein [Pseudomonas mandelii]MSU93062.1 hypothetical protein [Pseudomonas mandelii]
MSITDEMLARVNEEPLEVVFEVCSLITGLRKTTPSEEICLEVVLFLESAIEAGLIEHHDVPPNINDGKVSKAQAINFANAVKGKILAAQELEKSRAAQIAHTSRFKQAIKGTFGYEFTEGDIKRVQALINELRGLLTTESSLDAAHKTRLLLRLEALQKELHKKISTLASFYVLVGDAGVVLEKLGHNAKPIVDRIREIVDIGWNSQARAEELPSSSENPMLGHDDEPAKLD